MARWTFLLFGLRETLEAEFRHVHGPDASVAFVKARSLVHLSRALAAFPASAIVINAEARAWDVDVARELAKQQRIPLEMLRDDDGSVALLERLVARYRAS